MKVNNFSRSHLTQRFIDKELESKYVQSHLKITIKKAKVLSLGFIVTGALFAIPSFLLLPCETGLFIFPLILVATSLIHLVLVLIKGEYTHAWAVLFKIMLFVGFIENANGILQGQQEIIYKHQSRLLPFIFYIFGIITHSGEIPWNLEIIFMGTISVYVPIRIFHDDMILGLFVGLGIFCTKGILLLEIYKNEGSLRANFIKLIQSQNKLQIWKYILDEIHPDTTYLIDSEEYFSAIELKKESGAKSFLKKATNYFLRHDSIFRIKSLDNKIKMTKSGTSNRDKNKNIYIKSNTPSQDEIRDPQQLSGLSEENASMPLNLKSSEEMLNLLETVEVRSCVWPKNFANKEKFELKRETKVTDIINIVLTEDININSKVDSQNAISFSRHMTESAKHSSYIETDLFGIDSKKKKILHMTTIIKGVVTFKKRIINLNLKLVKFYFEGKPWIFICFEDKSDHHELIQLKELDRFKDRLLASVTHDLRTPLNTVIIMLENARESSSQEGLNECLQIADVNAKLLQNLICDILDYSLFKENKLKLQITEFILNDIVEEVFILFRFQAEIKGVQLIFQNLLEDQETRIISDSRRLKQVLINLVSNAMKFTSKGSITVTVLNIEPELLRFEVRDTGAGIKPENMANLFKPFSTFDNNGGIGLGLTICQSIVANLGPCPRIFVSTNLGRGSSFAFLIRRYYTLNSISRELLYKLEENLDAFEKMGIDELKSEKSEELKPTISNRIPDIMYLDTHAEKNPFDSVIFNIKEKELEKGNIPIIERSQESSPITSELFSIKLNKFNKLTILIVDDNLFNIFILERYLMKISKIHFDIIKAYSGLAAVNIFKERNTLESENPVQIIFMDCQMPECDGYEAVKLINQICRENPGVEVPVIAACTAFEGKEERDKCFDVGMDFFLKKPITEEEFKYFFHHSIGISHLFKA